MFGEDPRVKKKKKKEDGPLAELCDAMGAEGGRRRRWNEWGSIMGVGKAEKKWRCKREWSMYVCMGMEMEMEMNMRVG